MAVGADELFIARLGTLAHLFNLFICLLCLISDFARIDRFRWLIVPVVPTELAVAARRALDNRLLLLGLLHSDPLIVVSVETGTHRIIALIVINLVKLVVDRRVKRTLRDLGPCKSESFCLFVRKASIGRHGARRLHLHEGMFLQGLHSSWI